MLLLLLLMLMLMLLLTLPQPAAAAGPTWSQQMAAGADRVCFPPPSHGGDAEVCVTRLKDGTPATTALGARSARACRRRRFARAASFGARHNGSPRGALLRRPLCGVAPGGGVLHGGSPSMLQLPSRAKPLLDLYRQVPLRCGWRYRDATRRDGCSLAPSTLICLSFSSSSSSFSTFSISCTQ